LALVGDHQGRAQLVQGRALVELAHDPTPILIVGLPPQHGEGPDQPAICLEGRRHRVWLWIRLHRLHQERRGDLAKFHRAGGS
jgi:hypothetical protein